MAQNRPPWLRLATQRFDNLPARPAPTPAPTATPPQVLAPTPPPPPPRVVNALTSVQSREPVPALVPAPTLAQRLPPPIPMQPAAPAPPRVPALVPTPTLAPRLPTPTPMQPRAPAPPPAAAAAATPARAPSPTPVLTPVRPQLPQRQVSQQTPPPPALQPPTPPKNEPPSPSPPQRQAFQPAPTRTSPPEDVFQAPKSQPASPPPPPQLKGSPPRPQLQTAQPPSSAASPSPSPVLKSPEIVKNQVMTKYPTTAMEVKQAVPVKDIVPPNSHVAVITDSEKRNHTPPQHSKINKDDRVVPLKTAPPSIVEEITDSTLPQHSQTNWEGNSGPGLHRNRNIPVRDEEDHRMRIFAISGENNGATMEIIAGRRGAHNVANDNEKRKKDVGNNAAAKEGELAKKEAGHRQKPVSAMVNSNVQSINNSIVYGCNCSHNNPGVHLSLHGKPAVFKPQAAPTTIALGTSSK